MAVMPRWEYGLFWSMAISNIISFLVVYVFYARGGWRRNAIVVTDAGKRPQPVEEPEISL